LAQAILAQAVLSSRALRLVRFARASIFPALCPAMMLLCFSALMMLPVHAGPSEFLGKPAANESGSAEPSEPSPRDYPSANLSEAAAAQWFGHYNIVVDGTHPGGEYLSCRPDGYVEVFSTDDGSGRQRWQFTAKGGREVIVYNIKITRGTHPGEEYLSCRADGFVDLYSVDDFSGRQQWILQHERHGYYTIRVYGGTWAGKTFLSARPDGSVELSSRDDRSARQLWRLYAP